VQHTSLHKEITALQNNLGFNFVQPGFLNLKVKIPCLPMLFQRRFSDRRCRKIFFEKASDVDREFGQAG